MGLSDWMLGYLAGKKEQKITDISEFVKDLKWVKIKLLNINKEVALGKLIKKWEVYGIE